MKHRILACLVGVLTLSTLAFGVDTVSDYIIGARANGGRIILEPKTAAGAKTRIMTLDPTGGNVGIGTETPLAKLDIKADTNASLGSELITTTADRDMSGANNWSGTGWTVGAGVYTHVAGANNATLSGYSATSSSMYQVTMTVVTTTPGVIYATYGGGGSALSLGRTAGTVTDYTTIIISSPTAGLVLVPDATWAGSVDNISVKLINKSSPALSLMGAASTTPLVEGRAVSGDVYSVGLGFGALRYATTGLYNAAIGGYALGSLTTGGSNVALGTNALANITSSAQNVAISRNALRYLVQGSDNVAMGYGGTVALNLGSANVSVGSFALTNLREGSNNISLGYYAGGYNTASSKLYIDAFNRTNTAGDDAAAIITGTMDATPANQILRFNAKVGIGTGSPASPLHVLTNGTSPVAKFAGMNGDLAAGTGVLKVIGARSDANTSGSFAGGVALSRLYSSGAIANNIRLGRVYFGGNHTDGTEANILYSSVIEGVSEGVFSNSTTMPTGLRFMTGSSGVALDSTSDIGLERMRITSSGNIGIGTTAPTSDLAFGGLASRTIQMERHTTAATAGNSLTLKAGGATSGSTDKLGGDLLLSSGIATGSGSSNLTFQTVTAGTTGTTDRTPTTKMTILGNGDVGIGTSAPTKPLHVVRASGGASIGVSHGPGGTGDVEYLLDAANGNFATNEHGYLRQYHSTGYLTLGSYNRDAITIDTAGKVGIGTTAPGGLLSVGSSTTTNTRIRIDGTSAGIDFYEDGVKKFDSSVDSGNYYIQDADASKYAYLTQDFTAWTFASDARLKENVVNIEDGLSVIMKVLPRKFNFIGDAKENSGFIAQELREVLPEAVNGTELPYSSSDSKQEKLQKSLGVSSTTLIPYLVKALQEQQSTIELQKKWICEQDNAPSELCGIN